ncbi:hypothetical protein ACFPH6_25015 [Streptomyces xiangluensis]|uniref:Leucine rich repeat variant n=1 Tax=Streptomyces xiangluensis TaxID=2665720 RepID=A0ABV8YU14_9ACTN
MNHVLCGLAANTALPPELVDRLIAVTDADIASDLAGRADLSRAQAIALYSRVEESGVRLAHEGRLTATDVDPQAQPDTALALLDKGAGNPEWGRLLATDPAVERREKLAACSGLPSDVVATLATDSDVRVVAELALWTTPDVATGLAGHPYAEVRRAVAGNEATPPAVLAALISGKGLPPAQRCLVCDREKTPFTHNPQCARLDCELPPGVQKAFREVARHRQATPQALLACLTDAQARRIAAGHPALPPPAIVELLTDDDWQVVEAAAGNPSLPRAAMLNLVP